MDNLRRLTFTKGSILTLGGLFIVVLLIGTYSFFTYRDSQVTKSETESLFENNENFEPYTDLQGNPVSLADYLDKIVVVHSWASWCPSCIEQIKLFQSSTANNNDQVQIIAINRAESINTIERFKNAFAIEDSVLMVRDPSDRFYLSVGGYSMPETIIYDKEGTRALHVHGEITQSILEDKISELSK
jgi:thiol-disulfide isomerase/thioredoxin